MKRTITASRIVLVDKDNKPRIVLDAGWESGLASFDIIGGENSAFKVWVGVDDTPKIVLQRSDGRHMAVIALGENGEPVVALHDHKGHFLIRLGRWPAQSTPTIDVFKDGAVHWTSGGPSQRLTPLKKKSHRAKAVKRGRSNK